MKQRPAWGRSQRASQPGRSALKGVLSAARLKPFMEIGDETQAVWILAKRPSSSTPRWWPGKTAWAAAKRAEGFWRDVRVIDADDLIHWIERYPKVGHWLAVRVGKRPAGVRDLPELWSQWAGATQTPLTTEIILLGRDVEAAAVHKWLCGAPEVISIQAGSVEEAKAFLYACVNELPEPYLSVFIGRALAPADAASALRLADGGCCRLLVIESSEEGFPEALASKGHHVFVAFGSWTDTPRDALRLPSARRNLMQAALEQIGVGRHAAHNWAHDCMGSLTVLRRLMPPAPGRRPAWSLSPPSAALRAALLAGGWWDQSEADRAVLQRLTGVAYSDMARTLGAYLTEIDGPLRKAGEAWKLASPRDAWLLLAPYLTDADIATFLRSFTRWSANSIRCSTFPATSGGWPIAVRLVAGIPLCSGGASKRP